MARLAPAFALAGVPRVNLMPPLEIERRRRASLVRGWAWGVVAAVVVAFLLIAGAYALKLLADQRLAAEQAKTNTLLTELASLSEVSGALGTESDLTSFRADAMGSDFAWSPVISLVRGAMPAGVELVGFDLLTGGIPQTQDPTTEVGLVGTLRFVSATPIDLPAVVRDLRTREGIFAVDGRSLTTGQLTEGSYDYQLDVVFDESIYSGQFALTEGAE